MLNWDRMEAAGRGIPHGLENKPKRNTLLYLHKFAQSGVSTRRLSYNELFDDVVDGFGIRAHRLRRFLTDVAKAPRKDRSEFVTDSIKEMVENSKRSYRQKQNAA